MEGGGGVEGGGDGRRGGMEGGGGEGWLLIPSHILFTGTSLHRLATPRTLTLA